MGIEAELQDELKRAMRAKDRRTLDVVRMVKSRALEKKTAKGYHGGDLSDEEWVEVIASYVKQMEKALPEYEKAGEAGRETLEKLRFEIDYLGRWLPEKLGEAETRDLVDAAIAELGATDPQRLGPVMGKVMKEHKGQVDAQLVRRLAEERLREIASGS